MNAAHGRINTRNTGSRPARRVHAGYSAAWIRSIFAGLCLLFAGASAHAQVVTATVNAGKLPYAVATNPVTNKAYIVNNGSNSVTVVNGVTNSSTTITVGIGTAPYAVAVNPVTNLIFVTNNGSNSVSVINGTTDTVTGTAIAVGSHPTAVAVDPLTNKIYVANNSSGTVSAIDGNNLGGSPATITVGTTASLPTALAVNTVTDEIYVANFHDGTVLAINGATNSPSSPIGVGTGPTAIGVNTARNEIYVANYSSGNVTVINGSGNSIIATVSAGTNPNAIAVNPVTDKIYVANVGSANVTVIDGANNTNATTTTVATASGSTNSAVAVDPVTNQVYVATQGTNTVTVINGATSTVAAAVSMTLNAGTSPRAIAVNPVTNKIYVANLGLSTANSTVTVIDGATNITATIGAGSLPYVVAVNPITNKIYVANQSDGTVTVIDGTGMYSPATVPVGTTPFAIDVNPVTNLVYVANQGTNTVSVIKGDNTTVNPPITVGNQPYAVAVNSVTNKIYVVNRVDGTVSVIDGASGTVVDTVGLGPHPQAVAVNPVTNKAYFAVTDNNTVVAFDGADNPTVINVGANPWALAVNQASNKIYVANFSDSTVTMIDGTTNSTTSIGVGTTPIAVAVNPVTNKIYVANDNSNNVSVIDGTTNTTASTSTISVGQNPAAVAVNPVTNKIYVANLGATAGVYAVSIIDGPTSTVSSVVSGSQPGALGVNQATNQIYIANQVSNNVTVLAEQQVQTIPLSTSIGALAGNATSSLTPTFNLSTTNTLNAAPVNNVLYQVDTWEGFWTPASSQGGANFSAALAALQPGYHVLYAYATVGEEGTASNTGLQSSPLIGSIAAYTFLVAPGGATVTPTSLNFGDQEATTVSGPQTVTLTNSGAETLTFTITNTDSAEFPESGSDSCHVAGGQLAVGASCTISITFAPVAPIVPKSATLTITDNSNGIPGSTQTVTLSGIATGNVDPGLTWSAPAAISYGTALSATQLDATATAAGTFAYSPVAGTYLGAGPQTLSVTFTPNDPSTYTSATTTVQITVNPVTITVTANNATRNYAQANPAFSANYTGFVHGDTISVLGATLPSLTTSAMSSSVVGNYPIVAGPGNLSAANYTFAFVNGSLSVTQATPTVSWATPSPITYGTALSGTQLNASSTAIGGGAFSYTPPSTTVLDAGPRTLSVLFTPTDTTDYTTATQTVQLVVNQATPTITWSTPTAINYPAALSGTQLNASSPVGGTLAYTPPSGTILKAGSQPLSVTLTPSNSLDYTTATAGVTLQVNQTTPTITWATPAPITYGTALSAGQLDAVPSAPGTLVYTPAAGTVLGAGTQTLSVQFTPTDATDYKSATTTVQLIVNQAPPNSQATVTATLIGGTGPKAVAINPVTNKTYVANVGTANVTVIDGATNNTTSIGVGNQPDAVAVNPITNQIYVANYADGTVTVIDGTGNNSPSTITVGSQPTVIAVNPVTNKIYVVNSGDGTVTVINAGSGNTTTPVTVGTSPYAAAVNPVTNEIYVTNQGATGIPGSVTVIDGVTNSPTTVTDPTAINPYSVAVNAATNKVYVTNLISNTVTIIDPANGNAVNPIPVGTTPWAVAVNEVTNQVYVANYGDGTVTVINANNGNTTRPVTVGTNPNAVAVNPITNQIFVANLNSGNFTVIDGSSNTPTNVAVGTSPVAVAVNPVTDKIYVANNGSNNVSVVDGATNTTSTTATDSQPVAVAVNPVTNTIYTVNSNDSGSVTVINGSTTTSVPVGTLPTALAVNPLTNKVYVVNSGNITAIDGVTNTPTTVNVGNGPDAIALNPVTNEIFVTNYVDGTVAVVNGATNPPTVVTAVGVGVHPDAVAVNPVTNKIYTANIGSGGTLGTVTIVDGATNIATGSVNIGDYPLAIAVNSVTNKIYVANSNLDHYPTPGSVTVIDGVTGNTSTIAAGIEPFAIAVNQITNKIYVANKDGNSIMVIDGFTNDTAHTTFLTVGSHPFNIAINPVTNKIYVPNAGAVNGSYYVSVIDGATNFITTLSAGTQPAGAAVNPVTNQAYITNQFSNNVMALTEQQVQTIPITTTIHALAGNQTASLAPTFTFTATNSLSGAPVDNVFYQIDTWQGPWTPATSQGSGSFTATTGALQPGYHIIYAYATDSEEGTTTITGPQSSPLIGNIAAYGFAEVAQTGGNAGASVSPTSIAFGGQAKTTTSAPQTTTLVNASNAILTFLVSITGTEFVETIGSDTCSTLGGQLAANSSCTIGVTFTPSATGSRTATLTVTDNSNGVTGSTQTVSLSGTGTGNLSPGLAWTAPASITYGTPLSSTQLDATASVQGTFAYNPASGAILGVGPQTLSVTFTPQDTADYAAATTTVQITVLQATLTVTANSATRQYGQANPTFTPNYAGFVNGDTATSALTGSPAFSTTATTLSSAAAYPITVTQGTLASTNYTFSFSSGGNLTVTAATTTINWGPLAPITIGTPLGAAQLNATATIPGGTSVAGTFTYTPPATTVLAAGTQTLSVSFTPSGTNSANYSAASGTVTLQVNQASAAFVTSDNTTEGTWVGVYGGDGYSTTPNYQSLPNYATFQVQNQGNYTWNGATADPRALQTPDGTARVAATWYGAATFNFNISLTDGHPHQVALYAVDWDSLGRSETITVVDAVTGNQLDSRSISGFTNGTYLIWTLTGQVKINVTPNPGTGNAVVSGMFFGGSVGQESVSVSPSNVNLMSNGTQQFTATIHNAASQPVTWSISAVSPTGQPQGTLSSTGFYTAPASITGATTVTVTAATSDGNATGNATVNLNVTPPAATAAFIAPPDTTTEGNWIGKYGKDGYDIANVTPSVPTYATFSVQNQGTYTWNPATADPRALAVPGAAAIASTWYATGTFNLNVNFTDGQTHEFALYALDWDSIGRAETITVLDANLGTTLDTRTISNFSNGVYLVWNISGSVKINVTQTGPSNGTVSGVFFGGSSSGGGGGTETVSVTPSPVTLTGGGTQQLTATATNGTGTPTWAITAVSPTGAAQGSVSSTGFYTAPGTISVATAVTVTATAADGKATGTATVNLNPPGVGATATFVPPPDTTTEGSWIGKYGTDGYEIANVAPSLPTYATFTMQGQAVYTWNAAAAAPQALAVPGAPAIASTWYSAGTFTMNVGITDGGTHQFALYALDWDPLGRTETITLTDANLGTTLDTRSISNFSTGVYLVWNISGSVKITVKNTGPSNAVVSGVFFGGSSSGGGGGTETVSVTPSPVTLVGTGTQQFTATVTNGTGTPTWAITAVNPTGAAQGTVSTTGFYTAPGTVSVATTVTITATTADGKATGTATVNLNPPGVGATATFVPPPDTTTEGSWIGKYGTDGYEIANVAPSLPTYATFTMQGQAVYTWNAAAAAPQALAVPGAPAIASTWYSAGTFTMNVGITDGGTHQFALYALDWDPLGRTETITLTDANLGTTLDTRSISNFSTGVYLVWNISGSVKITVKNTGPSNAVVSGVFFGGSSSGGGGGTETVSVTPSPVTLVGTGTQQFTATVTNGTGTPTWAITAVNPTGAAQGTVSTTGFYTAPGTVSVATTVTITATTADGKATGTATVNLNPPGVGATATFVPPPDTTTEGSWIGKYGSGGYDIANVTPSLPSYVTFSVQNQGNFTWNPATADPRALAVPGAPAIASTWYAAGTFTLNVNFTDGQTHQFALYALDWDSKGRAETITIVDANLGTTLDTRTISNFSNGVYLVWNISGSVKINVTNTTASNAAVSGVFFGGTSSGGGGGTETVSVTPSPVTLVGAGTQQFTATVTNGTGTPTWAITAVNPTGAAQGTVSTTGFYTAPGTVSVATTVTITATTADGNATGTATVNLNPPGVGATATFTTLDTTTEGSWVGKYGVGGGYDIANVAPSLPAYVTFSVQNQGTYTWNPSTADPRALVNPNGGGGIASTWYSTAATFNLNLNFTDGQTHQFALYALDWDGFNTRAETITIVDANTGTPLDTRSISSFGNGVYLVWNISGSVKINVTDTAGNNAVVSGVFFK